MTQPRGGDPTGVTHEEINAQFAEFEQRVVKLAVVLDILLESIANGTADQVAMRVLRDELARDFPHALRVIKRDEPSESPQ